MDRCKRGNIADIAERGAPLAIFTSVRRTIEDPPHVKCFCLLTASELILNPNVNYHMEINYSFFQHPDEKVTARFGNQKTLVIDSVSVLLAGRRGAPLTPKYPDLQQQERPPRHVQGYAALEHFISGET